MTAGPMPRDMLFPWAPVVMACGIVAYFAVPDEPSQTVLIGSLLVSVVSGALAVFGPWHTRPAAWAVALLLGGLILATWRTADVAAPVLGYRYYGPIEGRIVAIDSSYSGAVRLTLDQVRLRDIPPVRRPERVRISLHGAPAGEEFQPGQIVMTTGHLSPPNAPVEPGGFDFRRHAWFQQLGAVGYTRVPVVLWSDPVEHGIAQQIYSLRLDLARAIQARIQGQPGAFAAAIVTGHRAGIDRNHVEDLRGANLAHLLAISGLHMGLLTGTVFLGLRNLMALWPWLALRAPVKKIAALCALVAAAVYLVVSGASVATERAFIMVAMVLVGVCLDRRALSLRSVAWAALLVMMMRPEAVMGPGFQMSFAATSALVVVYNALRDVAWWNGIPRWARGATSVLMSSLVAGAATAPIAAAHFNIVSHYGLIANLASVPVMGTLVMPGALVALAGVPFGLEGVGLFAMEIGIRWILWVAGTVAHLEGAVGHVVRPDARVLPMLVAGALALALMVGRWRWVGIVPMVAALAMWAGTERPEILITESGTLIGITTAEGRSLNAKRAESFAARNWLENDGDGVAQENAAARTGWTHEKGWAAFHGAGLTLVQLRGKTGAARVAEACETADLVVSNRRIDAVPTGCTVLDTRLLRRTGALALNAQQGTWHATSARAETAGRLWTDQRDPAQTRVVLDGAIKTARAE